MKQSFLKTYDGNKPRSQKSEIAQWKNDERKIGKESLQLYGLVKKATENLWVKLVTQSVLKLVIKLVRFKIWEIFKHK